MEHFPQVPGSIRLDSDALGRMHTQPSQKASDRQRQQAISQGLSSTAISRGLIEAQRGRVDVVGPARSSTAISRGLIEAIVPSTRQSTRPSVIHGDQPWPH